MVGEAPFLLKSLGLVGGGVWPTGFKCKPQVLGTNWVFEIIGTRLGQDLGVLAEGFET